MRSLGVRLTAWYALVFIASTLILFAAATLSIRASMRRTVVRTVVDVLETNRHSLESGGIVGLRQQVESPAATPHNLVLRLVDRDDATLFEYRSSPNLPLDPRTLPSVRGVSRLQSLIGGDGSRWEIGTTPVSGGRYLQMAVQDDLTEQLVGHLRSGLALLSAGALLLGLLGGFLFTRLSLRPMAELATTARQVIASGDLSLRVPESGVDELKEVSRLFNGVLARNQVLVTGMREALDNVAHDLRTPLTRLRTRAEVALGSSTDPAADKEALVDAIEQVDEVLGMLGTLMDISEAETGTMKLAHEVLDVGELVQAVEQLYAHVAEERGIRIQCSLVPGLSVRGDRNRLLQAIANLLDNALKYTATGGVIEIRSAAEDGWAVLSMKDNGLGIAAGDLPRIWDRLYRADPSRSRRGLGLGLSLVKAIVEAHGGEIAAASEPGRGSTFTLRLPLGKKATVS